MLLKKQWSMKKPMRKSENILRQGKWKWEHNTQKYTGCTKSSSEREVNSDTGLNQEIRKISNKQPNLPTKGIIKRRAKSKVSRKKDIIKIKAEINKLKTPKIYQKTLKTEE